MRLSNTNPEIMKRFQENLKLICWIIGWSDQDLADELDVHRVTVTKLKNGSVEMRKIQYLAIRSLVHTFYRVKLGDVYQSSCILSWIMKHIHQGYEQEEFEYFKNAISKVVLNTGTKVGLEKIHKNVIQEAFRILDEHHCLYGGEWQ